MVDIPVTAKISDSDKAPPSAMSRIYRILNDDIELVYPHTPLHDGRAQYSNPVTLPQSERRVLVRAIFAFVEGLSYSLRVSLLEQHSKTLKASEIMALNEEQLDITNSGDVRVKSIKASLMSLVCLTVKQYSKCYAEKLKLECAGSGFEGLVSSVRVRDRLMHPRSDIDLIITDEEITRAVLGFLWFHGAFVSMMIAELGFLRELVESKARQVDMVMEETQVLFARLEAEKKES